MTFGTLRIKSKGLRAPHWHFNANEHGYLLQVLSDYFSFPSWFYSLKHRLHIHYIQMLTGNKSRIIVDWCMTLVSCLK